MISFWFYKTPTCEYSPHDRCNKISRSWESYGKSFQAAFSEKCFCETRAVAVAVDANRGTAV